MEAIWLRIESRLDKIAPQVLATLQPGASEAQIKTAQEFLSIEFPSSVKASYRIHNGQSSYEYGFFQGREFLSLERIQDEWKVWKDLLDDKNFANLQSDPDLGIRSDWWNPLWIPLTYDGSGNHHCLDLNPAYGGVTGQIITMWHDSSEREIVAPSFFDWLERYALELELEQLVFDEQCNGIIHVDDAFI